MTGAMTGMAAPAAPAASTSLPSIRGRLGRALLGLALVWGLLVGAAVWAVLRHELHEVLDDGLQATALALADVAAAGADPGAGIGTAAAAKGSVSPADDAEPPFVWQLLSAEGRVLRRSPQAPAEPMLSPPRAGVVDASADWRVHAQPLAQGQWLLVGQSRAERLETALEVAAGTIAAALVVGLAGMLWLRWALARELQPLADLRRALAVYDPLRPDGALAPARREELLPVHQAIDALGLRLARRAEAEREFSAHAAHALRTPLAGIDAQLAVALREAPEPLRARLERLRGASSRLGSVVAALLTLFRSGGELRRQPVDIVALLARMPLERLEVELRGRPTIDADVDLLAAALINLLENAQRHGAHHVTLTVRARGLQLVDDGPGVSAAERERLSAALQRQDTMLRAAAADSGRLGLGLPLAERVARAHGGRLTLPPVDRGFAVDLSLGPEADT